MDRVLENFTFDTEPLSESFLTFRIILTTTLANQSFIYTITGKQTPDINPDLDPFTYTTDAAWYNNKEFYGIIINTSASNKSTAGFGQYQAYKRLYNTDLNTIKVGAINI